MIWKDPTNKPPVQSLCKEYKSPDKRKAFNQLLRNLKPAEVAWFAVRLFWQTEELRFRLRSEKSSSDYLERAQNKKYAELHEKCVDVAARLEIAENRAALLEEQIAARDAATTRRGELAKKMNAAKLLEKVVAQQLVWARGEIQAAAKAGEHSIRIKENVLCRDAADSLIREGFTIEKKEYSHPFLNSRSTRTVIRWGADLELTKKAGT